MSAYRSFSDASTSRTADFTTEPLRATISVAGVALTAVTFHKACSRLSSPRGLQIAAPRARGDVVSAAADLYNRPRCKLRMLLHVDHQLVLVGLADDHLRERRTD